MKPKNLKASGKKYTNFFDYPIKLQRKIIKKATEYSIKKQQELERKYDEIIAKESKSR